MTRAPGSGFALMAARVEDTGGAAAGGAAGGPRGACPGRPSGFKGACGVAARPDESGPGARRSLRPVGASGAVEAEEDASTRRPGPTSSGSSGVDGGGAGPVGRPGPVPPLHQHSEGNPMHDTTTQAPDTGWGDGDWRDGAVCRETDPELFFPTATGGHAYNAQVAAAKAVCAACPVRAECLTFALDALAVGIAGGLTEAERRRLRRREGAHRRAATRREQARELLELGLSAAVTAARFGVSTRTVERWAADDRTRRTTQPTEHPTERAAGDVARGVAS